uniref:Uncharacterized protein n=1 Tax=Arundo donax TaxID=35708 RepID=A0A0A8Y0S7_ARUDO
MLAAQGVDGCLRSSPLSVRAH